MRNHRGRRHDSPEEEKEKRAASPHVRTDSNGDIVDSKSEASGSDGDDRQRGKNHYHRSEAKSSKSGFFHRVNVERDGVSQVTNVEVNVQPANDDPCTGCFKAIVKCFK